MKMFSELARSVDGVLVDILIENGHGGEMGTPLFKIATQDAVVETAEDMPHQIVDSPWHYRFGILSFHITPKTPETLPRCSAKPRDFTS
jgi:hypothetical protein